MTTTTLAEWTPFILKPDSCIWTAEPCPDAPVVLLREDLFTGRGFTYRNRLDDNGDTFQAILFRCDECGAIFASGAEDSCGCHCREHGLFTFSDLRRSIFQTIDTRSQTRFIVATKYLERVRELWSKLPCPFCDCSPCEGLDECGSYEAMCYRQAHPQGVRENLTLAAYIDGPADLQKLPKLAELRELCGGLGGIYRGREEVDWWDNSDALSTDEGLGVDFTLILAPAEVDSELGESNWHAEDAAGVTGTGFGAAAIEQEERRIKANIESARSSGQAAGVEILEVKGE